MYGFVVHDVYEALCGKFQNNGEELIETGLVG